MSQLRQPPKSRRACIYARVSDDTSGRDKAVSIGEQIADCQKLLKANGDVLVATYIDDRQYRSEHTGRMVQPSGKRPDRPEWAKMLAAAGKEWQVLYAWRTDRICRGNETAGMFERVLDERRFDVVLVTQQFDRDTFALLAGGVSGYELRSINARMVMGREGRIKSGLHVGRPPQGYRALRNELGKNIGYELTPEGRAFLGELAALFLAGLPLADIGRQLGPNPATGRAYPYSTVRLWLASPFYRGQLSYGRHRPADQIVYNEKPSQHEPAWDAVTIAAIDAELARRALAGRNRARRRVHDHLLAGVLYCGYCGKPLMKIVTDWEGRHYKNYKCNPRRRGSEACPPNHISENVAVRLLRAEWATLNEQTIDAHLEARYGRPAEPPLAVVNAQASLDQLEAEAAELEADIERASPAGARRLAADLAELRADIATRQKNNAARVAQAAVLERAALRQAMLECVALNAIWDTLTRDQQREVVRHYPPVYVKHGQFAPVLPAL